MNDAETGIHASMHPLFYLLCNTVRLFDGCSALDLDMQAGMHHIRSNILCPYIMNTQDARDRARAGFEFRQVLCSGGLTQQKIETGNDKNQR